ncbi:MAG TPA: biotin/lipoyl-binding protein, partial [Terracidiphilus sp.]
MNARNRVFLILGLLTVGSLIYYFYTVRPTSNLKLIGTVDANEVVVSSKIPGRIQTLTVDEGQQVQAGQLIAIIESDDLQAARKAAEANTASQQGKLAESVETVHQDSGETGSATVNAESMLKAAKA